MTGGNRNSRRPASSASLATPSCPRPQPRGASAAVRELARRVAKLRRVALRDTARADALYLAREQLEQATDTVRGLARRATGYRTQLRALGVEPLVEDLSRCPFYRDPDGTCPADCSAEPRCLTEEPDTGWPLTRLAA